jgi:hypothetical protein
MTAIARRPMRAHVNAAAHYASEAARRCGVGAGERLGLTLCPCRPDPVGNCGGGVSLPPETGRAGRCQIMLLSGDAADRD